MGYFCDEDASSVGCHHVEVENGGGDAVERRALLHSTNPVPEGEHEKKGGDSFTVVHSRNGTGDVAGYDGCQDDREELVDSSFMSYMNLEDMSEAVYAIRENATHKGSPMLSDH